MFLKSTPSLEDLFKINDIDFDNFFGLEKMCALDWRRKVIVCWKLLIGFKEYRTVEFICSNCFSRFNLY